jgi:hypothetical protein
MTACSQANIRGLSLRALAVQAVHFDRARPSWRTLAVRRHFSGCPTPGMAGLTADPNGSSESGATRASSRAIKVLPWRPLSRVVTRSRCGFLAIFDSFGGARGQRSSDWPPAPPIQQHECQRPSGAAPLITGRVPAATGTFVEPAPRYAVMRTTLLCLKVGGFVLRLRRTPAHRESRVIGSPAPAGG